MQTTYDLPLQSKRILLGLWLAASMFTAAALAAQPPEDFPKELVEFAPYAGNPIFGGTNRDTWDNTIRERGWIMREDGRYRMWYSGYNPNRCGNVLVGYAVSLDGLHWSRYSASPIYDKGCWTEDMQVVKQGGTYYMFAEGTHDPVPQVLAPEKGIRWRDRDNVPHLLTSKDGIHWQERGDLDVRDTNGRPIPKPYGTPAVFIKGPTWYLFYERGDGGIWLATSTDRKVWHDVSDQPVIALGPQPYDNHKMALNQVIEYQGKYYGYYHAMGRVDGRNGLWTTCVAMSPDLIHWKKYPKNPILANGRSSGILVNDGREYRLYTMHPDVWVYFPRHLK